MNPSNNDYWVNRVNAEQSALPAAASTWQFRLCFGDDVAWRAANSCCRQGWGCQQGCRQGCWQGGQDCRAAGGAAHRYARPACCKATQLIVTTGYITLLSFDLQRTCCIKNAVLFEENSILPLPGRSEASGVESVWGEVSQESPKNPEESGKIGLVRGWVRRLGSAERGAAGGAGRRDRRTFLGDFEPSTTTIQRTPGALGAEGSSSPRRVLHFLM